MSAEQIRQLLFEAVELERQGADRLFFHVDADQEPEEHFMKTDLGLASVVNATATENGFLVVLALPLKKALERLRRLVTVPDQTHRPAFRAEDWRCPVCGTQVKKAEPHWCDGRNP
jgi:hypothetical protein